MTNTTVAPITDRVVFAADAKVVNISLTLEEAEALFNILGPTPADDVFGEGTNGDFHKSLGEILRANDPEFMDRVVGRLMEEDPAFLLTMLLGGMERMDRAA